MASFAMNRAVKDIVSNDTTLDLLDDTIKAVLVTSTYTPNRDDDVIDAGTGSDVQSGELSGTGYTGGFAGSGRKTLASKTVTESDANDRAEFTAAAITWTAINAGTIAGMVLVKEITNDTSSRVIAFLDSSSFPLVTNGGDVTITPASAGLIQFSTT